MDIESLINKHKDSVYRQLVRVCGNEEDAEDALADAFLAALKASDQLKDPDSFRAWLARVGTRLCVRKRVADRLARSTSLSSLEEKGFEPTDEKQRPDRDAQTRVLQSCVQDAIDALPEIYKEVYIGREILGESAEDVAHRMNLSVAAVKSRLHRARQMARESIDSGLGCAGIADDLD